mmetsp:Transcript_24440/g.58975  ORF Transcript_24440/g.58975 Transcript_24440/m.58975 type:complete len:270 (-) Transcript_24440:53-862(-)
MSIHASLAASISRRVWVSSATKFHGSASECACRIYNASRPLQPSNSNHHRRPRRNLGRMASGTSQSKSVCPSSGTPLLTPAGPLFEYNSVMSPHTFSTDTNDDEDELDVSSLPKGDDNLTERVKPSESDYFFIPQVKLHDGDGGQRKRVLVLCTGGTLTMAPNPDMGGALSPVPGALTDFMKSMLELTNPKMPDVVVHEYSPLLDSSDMGPPDWQVIARDIKANYLHFDGFVVLMGTDTMAYTATALSFMLENLGKPVVFTGSQVPIGE